MGKPLKLKYQIEVEVRRRLVDGEEVDSIARDLGVHRSSVSVVHREILAATKRTLSEDVEQCVKAVLDAAKSWNDADSMPIGSEGKVECRFCGTSSHYDSDWKPSSHIHRPTCIVHRARKIADIIRRSFG